MKFLAKTELRNLACELIVHIYREDIKEIKDTTTRIRMLVENLEKKNE